MQHNSTKCRGMILRIVTTTKKTYETVFRGSLVKPFGRWQQRKAKTGYSSKAENSSEKPLSC